MAHSESGEQKKSRDMRTKSDTKSGNRSADSDVSAKSLSGGAMRRVLTVSVAALLVAGGGGYRAVALPTDGVLVSGQGGISAVGKEMTVKAGDRAIFEFGKFNIASDEAVRFVQPGLRSTVLARATDGTASEIFGRLEANGRLILANPAGIHFRDGSMISVGGLLAAAGHVSSTDFERGEAWASLSLDLTGTVSNAGTITSQAGVALVGLSVENTGSIVAPEGGVMLVSDARANVYLSEVDGDITVIRGGRDGESCDTKAVKAAASESGAGVTQAGSVRAKSVYMGAGDIYAVGIRHTGKTKAAQSVTMESASAVKVSGVVDVSSSDQKVEEIPQPEIAIARVEGGDVVDANAPVERIAIARDALPQSYVPQASIGIFGDSVHLENAQLIALGNLRGGSISLSANQGVFIDRASVLDVSGSGSGSAGSISIFGSEVQVDGSLLARGGDVGGDGGTIWLGGTVKLGLGESAVKDVSAVAGAEGAVTVSDPESFASVEPVTFSDGSEEDVSGTVLVGGPVPFDGPRPLMLAGTMVERKGGELTLDTTASGTLSLAGSTGGVTVTGTVGFAGGAVMTLGGADSGVVATGGLIERKVEEGSVGLPHSGGVLWVRGGAGSEGSAGVVKLDDKVVALEGGPVMTLGGVGSGVVVTGGVVTGGVVSENGGLSVEQVDVGGVTNGAVVGTPEPVMNRGGVLYNNVDGSVDVRVLRNFTASGGDMASTSVPVLGSGVVRPVEGALNFGGTADSLGGTRTITVSSGAMVRAGGLEVTSVVAQGGRDSFAGAVSTRGGMRGEMRMQGLREGRAGAAPVMALGGMQAAVAVDAGGLSAGDAFAPVFDLGRSGRSTKAAGSKRAE
jgi:filamentous hemagglutinin family protein